MHLMLYEEREPLVLVLNGRVIRLDRGRTVVIPMPINALQYHVSKGKAPSPRHKNSQVASGRRSSAFHR